MTGPIEVLLTVPSLYVRDGGPSYVVASAAQALSRLPGVSVRVAARVQASEDVVQPGAGVEFHPLRGGLVSAALALRGHVRVSASRTGFVLHDNGIWSPMNAVATQLALANNVPYAISVHGMLEPWALEYRNVRKRVARALYQDRLINGARCLIANSEMEYSGIRKAGYVGPIAVIPHGAELPVSEIPRTAPPTPRIALFLSRIHPKKGLVHAIEAWAELRPADWHLKIVGPGDKQYLSSLQQLVEECNLRESVSFHPSVSGIAKFQCYRNADLFILPTYSENFGVVVVEALASGLPVLTTTGTPWQCMSEVGCGWVVETGTEPLTRALTGILSTPSDLLLQMGAKGRDWISREFRWELNAERNMALYRWMLGREPMPDEVRLA